MYLRDNRLTHFNVSRVFPGLRVLDLSGNQVRGLAELACAPNLTQVYLSGNCLTGLEDMPTLPNLEVLSVSHNRIRSLVMPAQPQLRLLFAGDNAVADLRGLVAQPVLEEVDLAGNPVASSPLFRIAVVHASREALFRINGVDLDQTELDVAYSHPVKVVECVRHGMLLQDGMPEDYADRYLLQLQRDATAELPVRVAEARIEGGAQPVEGRALVSVFEFDVDDGFLPSAFQYQWFVSDDEFIFHPIPNTNNQSYTPTYDEFRFGLKVECTAMVNGRPALTAFALSDNVGCGEPECPSLVIEGTPVEGVTLSAVAKYVGGTPGTCQFRWFRIPDATDVPELLNPDEPTKYQLELSREDVNARICVEFTPVRADGARGTAVEATTLLVQPAVGSIPTLRGLRLRGAPMEGEQLQAVATLQPSPDNVSDQVVVDFRWYRLKPLPAGGSGGASSPGSHHHLAADDAVVVGHTDSYTAGPDDIGCVLRVVALPRRLLDGLEGTPVSASTGSPVAAGLPTVDSLVLLGKPKEFSKLAVQVQYRGGVEGTPVVRWMRTPVVAATTSSGTHNATQRVDAADNQVEYSLTAEDVDHIITVEYIPVRRDGVMGTPVRASTQAAVTAGFPSLTRLELLGKALERETVHASLAYTGGREGPHELSWHLVQGPRDASEGQVIEAAANQASCAVGVDAVGRWLRLDVVPVRADLVRGERVSVYTSAPVAARPPAAGPITILGQATEKHTLSATTQYVGGRQGNSRWQWFSVLGGAASGAVKAIQGANGPRYRVQASDVGNALRVDFTPVRDDGVVGPVVSALTDVVDRGADPESPIGSVELVGRFEVGGVVTAVAVYDGGVEGDSVFQWYRVDGETQQAQLIPGTAGSTHTCAAEDLGFILRVDYVPHRNDGRKGDVAIAVSPRPVGAATVTPPAIQAVEIVEAVDVDGSRVLRVIYGYDCAVPEGKSTYRWFRIAPGEAPVLVSEGTSPILRLTGDMLGARAYVEVTPVNEKGHVGATRTTTTNTAIAPAHHQPGNLRQSSIAFQQPAMPPQIQQQQQHHHHPQQQQQQQHGTPLHFGMNRQSMGGGVRTSIGGSPVVLGQSPQPHHHPHHMPHGYGAPSPFRSPYPQGHHLPPQHPGGGSPFVFRG